MEAFSVLQADVFNCYTRFLMKTSMKGKTVLQLTILPDGSVERAQVVETTIGDAEATACVEARASKWKTAFRPPAPRIFRYPINIE